MNNAFYKDIISNNNYKDVIGKILFAISILIFISMIFSPLSKMFINVDEYFTLGLIKFSFNDLIIISTNDVHPPLYYVILKLGSELLNVFGIKYNLLFVSKMITILPYLFIIFIAGTKIKKEYGWLTAGLMVFTLGVMSEFYLKYLTIRMYSWALLFLLISFIYLKEVMNESDSKSWIIFTLATLCCAYTHYFTAISSGVIYLILIYNILFNNKKYNKRSELKKWIISVVCLLVCYLPWIFVLFNQMVFVHNYMWIRPVNIYIIAHVLFYFISPSYSSGPLKIMAILFLIFLIFMGVYYYKNVENKESYDYYGAIILIVTLLILIILSLTYKPILCDRYLIPAIGLFWFSISICIGKINNNKILGIILVLIFCFSLFGAVSTFNEINDLILDANNNLELFNEINNNDSIIIFVDNFGVIQFGNNLNNANIYTNNKMVNSVPIEKLNYAMNITFFEKISDVVKYNGDKDVYLVINEVFNDVGDISGNGDNVTLVLNDEFGYSNYTLQMDNLTSIGSNDFYKVKGNYN